MKSPKHIYLHILALTAFGASASVTSAITITASNVGATVLTTSSGNGVSVLSLTGIPSSQYFNVTRGDFYSRTQVDYTGAGNQVTLFASFDQKRDGATVGNISAAGPTSGARVFFTADTDVSYDISGSYNASHLTTAGYVYFNVVLQDLTTNAFLEYHLQSSTNTVNETYALGGSGGDFSNANIGSLTGSLLSGHNYMFFYNAKIEAYPDVDGGATATGFARLDIGGGAPSSSVPDGGATVAMLGLTLSSVAVLRRKLVRG